MHHVKRRYGEVMDRGGRQTQRGFVAGDRTLTWSLRADEPLEVAPPAFNTPANRAAEPS